MVHVGIYHSIHGCYGKPLWFKRYRLFTCTGLKPKCWVSLEKVLHLGNLLSFHARTFKAFNLSETSEAFLFNIHIKIYRISLSHQIQNRSFPLHLSGCQTKFGRISKPETTKPSAVWGLRIHPCYFPLNPGCFIGICTMENTWNNKPYKYV